MSTVLNIVKNSTDSTSTPCFRVLGVRVDAVQIPDVVAQMEQWIARREASRYVAVTGMHGVTEAHHDATLKHILSNADLVVPDGMPLVWIGRWSGHDLKRRVYGPELMLAFMQETGNRYRHYFYGGAPGVPERLAERLRQKIPELQVTGVYSPPFRPLTEEEERSIAARINDAAPDVVWVGLSTPKQEKWMHRFRSRLSAPVLVGVGAAFDIHSGRAKQAPAWMRENGLEWLFRLITEPRRLWRRYLLLGPKFVFLACLELLGVRVMKGRRSNS